jgi:hypothetical protein
MFLIANIRTVNTKRVVVFMIYVYVKFNLCSSNGSLIIVIIRNLHRPIDFVQREFVELNSIKNYNFKMTFQNLIWSGANIASTSQVGIGDVLLFGGIKLILQNLNDFQW